MINKIYEKIRDYIKENYKFLIGAILIVVVFTYELPYVIYTPGGNINLNERIDVENGYETEGSFNMAYVTVFNGNLPTVILSYILPNWDLEKKENITLEEQSYDELLILDKLQMDSSIDMASIVAYNAANKEIEITKENLNVAYIEPDAKTTLEVGDIILSADDQEFTNFEELTNYIDSKEVDEEIKFTVLRDKKTKNATGQIRYEEDTKKIGIVFVNTYEFDENPNLTVNAKQGESGPSGGLMLTLAIYNSLVEEDISKGRNIVGTGTIDEKGNVGEIDGIKYKLLGSKDADIFLCPEGNYEEAIKVKEEFDLEMEIIKVKTFDEALTKIA